MKSPCIAETIASFMIAVSMKHLPSGGAHFLAWIVRSSKKRFNWFQDSAEPAHWPGNPIPFDKNELGASNIRGLRDDSGSVISAQRVFG